MPRTSASKSHTNICNLFYYLYHLLIIRPIHYVLLLHKKYILQFQPVTYHCPPPSNQCLAQLKKCPMKTLVLDLDETLIHSQHNCIIPYDFSINVKIDGVPTQFYVYKRPHLDFFLQQVSQWYYVVLFTASLESYANAIASQLDPTQLYIKRRYFRHNCSIDFTGYTKDLRIIQKDLSRIFIIDNSPTAYKGNPDNAIPIKSWYADTNDTCLLELLPVLDALRFTKDVRSILKRNIHLHSLW